MTSNEKEITIAPNISKGYEEIRYDEILVGIAVRDYQKQAWNIIIERPNGSTFMVLSKNINTAFWFVRDFYEPKAHRIVRTWTINR